MRHPIITRCIRKAARCSRKSGRFLRKSRRFSSSSRMDREEQLENVVACAVSAGWSAAGAWEGKEGALQALTPQWRKVAIFSRKTQVTTRKLQLRHENHENLLEKLRTLSEILRCRCRDGCKAIVMIRGNASQVLGHYRTTFVVRPPWRRMVMPRAREDDTRRPERSYISRGAALLMVAEMPTGLPSRSMVLQPFLSARWA